ncbi:MAG: fibro-slime domain-containing protein [Oscillospiraceae bacterium]|nr:fibro-slime domain-containing protein [Oscillospiraceae bacterium]
MWNSTTNARTSKVTVTYDNRGTTWRYMIVDLTKTGAATSDEVTAIYGYLPAGTGVAFAGYFSTEAAAKAYGESALEYTGQTYHYAGDNRAFGLLRYSRTTAYDTETISDCYDSAGIYMANTFGDATELNVSILNLGYDYQLKGIIGDDGIATLGLLQPELVNGLPVYKQETVAYVARLLKDALEIPEVDSSTGYRNYQYVQGIAEARYGNIDLAQWLRNHCTSMGTYAASSQKNLVGKWEDVSGNITTWYDAAYFMLNSIFVSGSYNTAMDDYDYLVLSAATNTDGKKIYVFDGGFATSATPASATSAVKYDETNNTIQNSSGLGKTRFYYDENFTQATTTYYPLLPIVDENGKNTNGVTESVYFLDPGVASTTTGGNTYVNRNYNYVMASNGEFTYYADEDLYFNFEGDDDVYLFIDGKLVLDLGGAHSITSYKLNLNDYADTLGLVDGDTYAFDFYYMERHGVGANMRVETNIRVTNPSMVTEKSAYVDGTQIEYGGLVNASGIVEYGFSITNNGEENLYNIGFTDDDIGVKLDPENGLTVTGERVYDVNGGTLEASDLTAVLSGENKKTGQVYDPITVTFADNNALICFLQNITSEAALKSGDGLWVGSTVAFRGIGYKLSDEQVKSGWFDNTVHSTATNLTKSKTLRGEDDMRVCVPSDPMYYQWADHKLQISLTKLIDDILAAAKQEGNTLKGEVPDLTAARVTNVVEVTKGGYAADYAAVTVNSDFSLTVNYADVGSHVFYLKIYYKVSDTNWPNVIVPVVVNVTDVEDSVYVLDYGLSVDLTAGTELTKNDVVTVPGRETEFSVLAVGSNGAYSLNEITFTTAQNNTLKATYGDFDYVDGTVKYTPFAFMEGIDTVQIAMNVYEKGTTPSKITDTLDINNEVEMYKSISVLPATVVYYEDCFPAITYTDTSVNEANVNTFASLGSQSNDQSQEYGQDEYYQDDMAESAGSLTTITISTVSKVASFEFNGTGFELIGRTNAYDSATLTVKVYKSSDVTDGVPNAGATAVKSIPVITEYDNGADGGKEEIYQVPVIRVKDLDLDTYTVQITGIPARDSNGNITPTKLYVDGLRIYQPLGATNNNYTAEENGAQFIEIRNEIMTGTIAAAEFDGETLKVSTSTTTWTEKYQEENYSGIIYEGNEVDSIEEYLLQGPNNEVYMTGDSTTAALVFYVAEDADATVHNLQIAVHAVDTGLFYGTNTTGMNADIQYGVRMADGTYAWVSLDTVQSGTEQYYTIDYTKAPYTEGKGYQIAVRVEQVNDNIPAMASFTSLKLNGLTLSSIGGEATNLTYVNGILSIYYDKITSTDENSPSTASVMDEEIPANDGIAVASEVTTESSDKMDTITGKVDAAINGTADTNAVDASAYVDFQSVSKQMRSNVIVTADELDEPAADTPVVDEPETQRPAASDNTGRQQVISMIIALLKLVWGRK